MASSSSCATVAEPPSLNSFPKDSSLHSVEFATKCPPDASPRTRIIAVCGITDIRSLASPADVPVANQHFIKTVEDECKEATKTGQNVLLLVFSHGDIESYGVTIGSNSNTELREVSATRLTIIHLKIVVGKTQCALLITSCFSGGWAVNPDLNLTIIATAGPEVQSQSGNASLTQGFSGSIVAAAIRDAIFASEVEDKKNLGKPGMTYQELQTTETYAEIGCLVHDHLKQNNRFQGEHQMSFASQDDEWTKAWRERTGIPLAFFKEKWEGLSILPAQADGNSNREPSSAFTSSLAQCLSDTRLGSTILLTPTKTMPQIYTTVCAQAAGYASSFPGVDDLATNTSFHTRVRRLLSGEERYENRMDDLLTLGYTLSYRLEGMTMAKNYKDFLGLDYLDCPACRIEAWTYPLYESKEKEAKLKLSRFEVIGGMIREAKIFSSAVDGQGYDYDKPGKYLAIALVESNKTTKQVEEARGSNGCPY
ncbi:MAG: hypothetical protein M1839_006778 [Geoglossum umbratile]|nr:MAG: hypothetical protein M1839_006778 [Geoglossum umbratile]